MSTTNATTGYYSGTTDVYFALMTTADAADTAAVYATPEVLGKSIEIKVAPRYKEGKLYASNHAVRNEKRIDGYDVSLNLDQIPAAVRKKVLGRDQDSAGVQIMAGGQIAPYLAIGFGLTKDNNAKELWWLYKGKFSEIATNGKTEGDALDYQTPTLDGAFDRRMKDDALGAVADSDDTTIAESAITGWFTEVYERAAASEGA